MAEYEIRSGAFSIIGDRAVQQDSYSKVENPDGIVLAAVYDGMGGLQGGEKASQTCKEILEASFLEEEKLSVPDSSEWIMDMMNLMDRKVHELTTEDGETLGGGSTCVMVLADGHEFKLGCVGDSMIYLLREDELIRLTRMHNYNLVLDNMVKNGEINEEERLLRSAKGEALISYLGMGGLAMGDIRNIFWKDKDYLILCSDGLYKSLSDLQIKAIVEESGGNPQIAARRLCEEAYRLRTRKQDNTTVVVVKYTRTEECSL